MKKYAVILMVAGLFGAMPVFAAEGDSKAPVNMPMSQCSIQAQTIQEKINSLQNQINEGKKKLSAKEIKKLENKLKEANKILDQLNSP